MRPENRTNSMPTLGKTEQNECSSVNIMAKKPNGPKGPKAKITKEERRAKYTKLAKERREKQAKREWSRDVVCFKCRAKGHTSSDCGQQAGVLCYKCGSTEHSLKECSEYRNGDTDLPFASCYVCEKKGHLASACPENSRGIYVNGGACRKCGSTQHISAECPKSKANKPAKSELPEENFDDLVDGAGDMLGKPKAKPVAKSGEVRPVKKTRKVVTF